tara:strand:- start:12810 stop:14171 length:1362 start_codon:yes stop_codon:yes gene_type:complete
MKQIKSVSGIRGILNKSLFLEDISLYVKSFSKIQKNNNLPILVARDSRTSGEEITNHIIKQLTEIGRDVINCNIIPTPTAQYITQEFEIAGAIVVTASHNPSEWNGLKFIDSNGIFLNHNKNKKLIKLSTKLNDEIKISKVLNKGKISNYNEAINLHIDNILNLSFININKIKSKNFKIVIDTINGASCEGFKILLKKLNCEIIHINDEPNGIFNRNPEPKVENILHLSDIVKDNNADLAFVTDPDGDRLAMIDEKGKIIIEENTIVLCALNFLSSSQNNNPIITNLSTTSALEDIANKYNIDVFRTPVGEVNVVNEMLNNNSNFGGEGNGGIILKESHYGRDAFVGCIMILDFLAKENIQLSNANEQIPKYHMLKEKVDIISKINFKKLANDFGEKYPNSNYDLRDGLKISEPHFWAHIRKSNTEPIVRIYIESKEKNITQIIFNEIKSFLN